MRWLKSALYYEVAHILFTKQTIDIIPCFNITNKPRGSFNIVLSLAIVLMGLEYKKDI